MRWVSLTMWVCVLTACTDEPSPQGPPVAPLFERADLTISRSGGAVEIDAAGGVARLETRCVGRGGRCSDAAEERLERAAAGVEQSWIFSHSPPGRGDLVVEIAVEGARLDGDGGPQLVFSTGPGRFSYGEAAWVDATGTRAAVPTTFRDGLIRIEVADALLERSVFPAVLDPLIGNPVVVDPVVATVSPPGSNASAAFNGSQHLVSWYYSVPSLAYTRRGTRLSPAGQVLDPSAIDLTILSSPWAVMASNGQDYLIVAPSVVSGTSVARVSAAGVVLDAAPIVISATPSQKVAAAGNANGYLVAMEQGANLVIQPLSSSGQPTGTALTFGAVGNASHPVAAVVHPNGNDFIVAWHTSVDGILAITVAPDGTSIQGPQPLLSSAYPNRIRLAANATHLAMTYQNNGAWIRRFDPDLVPLDASALWLGNASGEFDLAASASGFLFAWGSILQTHAVFVPNAGSFGPADTLSSSHAISTVALSADPAGFLLVAGGSGDETGMKGLRLGPSGVPQGAFFDLGVAPNRQVTGDAVALPSGYVIVYADNQGAAGFTRARFFDATGGALGPPVNLGPWSMRRTIRAAASPSRLFVAGRASGGGDASWAKLFDHTGNPVTDLPAPGPGAAVTWDGTHFVTVNNAGQLRRIDENGAVVATGATAGNVFRPDIACFANECVIVAQANAGGDLYLHRIDATFAAIDAFHLGKANDSQPRVAAGPGGFGIAWHVGKIGINPDQRVLGTFLPLGSSSVVPIHTFTMEGGAADIASDGDGFYVTWNDLGTSSLRGRGMASGGSLSPTEIIASGSMVDPEHSVTAVSEGVYVVQLEEREAASGYWIERLFTQQVSHTMTGAELGAACLANSECKSKQCVDGVCCNGPCGGPGARCGACSIAAGASEDGICTVLPPGTLCRPAASDCDIEEVCGGGGDLACPPDEAVEDGLSCDDGDACSASATCQSGACVADAAVICPTAGECAITTCDPASGCGEVPAADGTSCSIGVCQDGLCVDPGGPTGPGSGGTTGAPGPRDDDGADGGGCGCRSAPTSRLAPWWILLASLLVSRRQRGTASRRRGADPRSCGCDRAR
jgi:hypothetical protein